MLLPHLKTVLTKLLGAGYRLDALSEAWSKDAKDLEIIIQSEDLFIDSKGSEEA